MSRNALAAQRSTADLLVDVSRSSPARCRTMNGVACYTRSGAPLATRSRSFLLIYLGPESSHAPDSYACLTGIVAHSPVGLHMRDSLVTGGVLSGEGVLECVGSVSEPACKGTVAARGGRGREKELISTGSRRNGEEEEGSERGRVGGRARGGGRTVAACASEEASAASQVGCDGEDDLHRE